MGYVKAQKLEVIEQNCSEIWIHHIKISKKNKQTTYSHPCLRAKKIKM